MSFAFDPRERLILVEVDLWGPNGAQTLRFGLDTGATETVVSVVRLARLGYGYAPDQDASRLITGSGIAFAPRVILQRVLALGQERFNFPVLALFPARRNRRRWHAGLDFLRGLTLTIDFRNGELSLV